ncbi:gp75 [Mycobacterium phage PLot]|uniref:Uncharacterized protein n=18 Tax=Plotvirus TaxID=2169613 RepID=Q19Y74_9CAUD|nr:gp75 [Mycobacterium phage Troll4]YP_002241970.1 gp77 [Mycobacterium phage Gumball]YP_655267.1 gp71 [Mycobacterium phage PBI1]YP_655454.1 gp75 [Mycobacterium phage PLot]ACD49658.1 hypothetical protein Adjutor_73 [Mycobacterium phage Adjutor]ACI06361.1 hypothetical protein BUTTERSCOTCH_73 [Mycobacterium phage Butterscotch]AEK10286.1 hypothetical protein PBI_SIRHARLEY_77 [Mycobacterium phage SirHarley]AER49828.1 hypothetical protein NOVA_75 [Mycobacterium phage Nova]AVP43171.1 hypothetical 
MKLTGTAPRTSRVSGWVEPELDQALKEYARELGTKTSPALRRVIILGLRQEGFQIDSEVVPMPDRPSHRKD